VRYVFLGTWIILRRRRMWMTNVPERAIANETSPAVVLRHLSTGFWISQAIAVAAALGIADHLQHGA
jgi:hypothetical protein